MQKIETVLVPREDYSDEDEARAKVWIIENGFELKFKGKSFTTHFYNFTNDPNGGQQYYEFKQRSYNKKSKYAYIFLNDSGVVLKKKI